MGSPSALVLDCTSDCKDARRRGGAVGMDSRQGTHRSGKRMGWNHSALSLNSVSRECHLITFNEELEPGTGEVAQELRALSSP